MSQYDYFMRTDLQNKLFHTVYFDLTFKPGFNETIMAIYN